MSFKGKLNIYTCEKCKRHVVTRDEDEGVTPFLIRCQKTEGCKGMMQSSLYRVYDQTMKPDYVWYRPSNNQKIQKIPSYLKDHVSNGGLLLKKYEEKNNE